MKAVSNKRQFNQPRREGVTVNNIELDSSPDQYYDQPRERSSPNEEWEVYGGQLIKEPLQITPP